MMLMCTYCKRQFTKWTVSICSISFVNSNAFQISNEIIIIIINYKWWHTNTHTHNTPNEQKCIRNVRSVFNQNERWNGKASIGDWSDLIELIQLKQRGLSDERELIISIFITYHHYNFLGHLTWSESMVHCWLFLFWRKNFHFQCHIINCKRWDKWATVCDEKWREKKTTWNRNVEHSWISEQNKYYKIYIRNVSQLFNAIDFY